MNEAPLFSSDRQQPPEGGRAAWLQAVDGVRTRAGYWPSAATPEAVRGTAILFPGRTEYVEKYYAPVTQFRRLGFAVSAMDWRGQGLADRALKDRRAGYVRDFAEFQRDADAYLGYLSDVGAPRPWVLVGHSMGGAIAARCLMRRGEEFKAAILSAPMLGIYGGMFRHGASRAIAALRVAFGGASRYVVGCDRTTGAENGFEDNYLTNDPEQFADYVAMLAAHDDLALGGPTWGWLRAAYREIGALKASAVPTLIVFGDADRVVDLKSSRAYLRSHSDGEILMLPGARHEPFIETEALQAQLWPALDRFLEARGV